MKIKTKVKAIVVRADHPTGKEPHYHEGGWFREIQLIAPTGAILHKSGLCHPEAAVQLKVENHVYYCPAGSKIVYHAKLNQL